MPADALPVSNAGLPGTYRFRRVYRDAINRPMTGTLTLLGTKQHQLGDVVVPVAPVTLTLVNGVVEADLPPDTYSYTSQIKTVEGVRLTDQGTISVP